VDECAPLAAGGAGAYLLFPAMLAAPVFTKAGGVLMLITTTPPTSYPQPESAPRVCLYEHHP